MGSLWKSGGKSVKQDVQDNTRHGPADIQESDFSSAPAGGDVTDEWVFVEFPSRRVEAGAEDAQSSSSNDITPYSTRRWEYASPDSGSFSNAYSTIAEPETTWTATEVLESKSEYHTIDDRSRESVLVLESEYPRPLSVRVERWFESAALFEHTLERSEPVAMEVAESAWVSPDTEAPTPDTYGASNTVDADPVDTNPNTWFGSGDVIGQWMSECCGSDSDNDS